MERDVRATAQPVTQRFCAINTSCSLWWSQWWQFTEQPHKHTHAEHTHAHTHALGKHPTAWRVANILARRLCCRPDTESKTSAAASLAERVGCSMLIQLSTNIFYQDSFPKELDMCLWGHSFQTEVNLRLPAQLYLILTLQNITR